MARCSLGSCGADGAELRCSRCKVAHYCDRQCQRTDWSRHKQQCTGMAAAAASTQHSARDSDASPEAGPVASTAASADADAAAPPAHSTNACGSCRKEVSVRSLKDNASPAVWCRRCREVVYCNAECKAAAAAPHAAHCQRAAKGACPDGYTLRGCSHYERGCALIAPCCEAEYICRLCHDADDANPCDQALDRANVATVVCLACKARQSPAVECVECGTDFGVYICLKCKMFSDVDEGQFHCDGCKICRKGGQENFVHCDGCGMCVGKHIIATHKCLQDTLKRDCPICLEYLFESVHELFVPPACGHVMHRKCFQELIATSYKCPTCTKSLVDMKEIFAARRLEIDETPMPEEYRGWWVTVLCSDCGVTSDRVAYHVLGHPCEGCGGLNTAVTDGPFQPTPDSPPAEQAPAEGDSDSDPNMGVD
eukprot:m.122851 g.122851  ORF g.122851 m.122851 type:complete len:425 (+) comp13438_c0_seq1:170-1444(+)